MQRYGRDLFDRSLLSPPEILGTQDHHCIPNPDQDLLVHKLNLVDSRNPGQGGFTVRPQHNIVRKIDAQGHYIL